MARPLVSDFCGQDNQGNTFRYGAMRRKFRGMSQPMPDPAPNIAQLLAFYLEAGVDCALADEPVNRLADPDMVPAAREAAPAEPARSTTARSMPAPLPVPRNEPPPAPEAAIASAREAAGTAPTLEALRALLE